MAARKEDGSARDHDQSTTAATPKSAAPCTPQDVCEFIAAYSEMTMGEREARWPEWTAREEEVRVRGLRRSGGSSTELMNFWLSLARSAIAAPAAQDERGAA